MQFLYSSWRIVHKRRVTLYINTDLDLLVVCKVVLRGVHPTEKRQQTVHIGGLSKDSRLLFRFSRELSSSRLWQRLDIVDGEDTCPAFQLATPPILVSPIDNLDDIAFLESKLSGFGGFEGVQRPHPRHDRDTLLC